ncbi:spermidine synthase [Actinokineospora bangkokensis]|uniref:Spermidine synthase-like protein n=1 Tax=Actinokineospora bangkokensis TaxID=1193682 RepID=A0A1Q9LJT6_9PSEU|nr:fused MFS/spermidine synthase [Actinokineospora bangkokensis]OLR92306.1 spermidine synthase-like protein [Actinokineospora bangkokensis]
MNAPPAPRPGRHRVRLGEAELLQDADRPSGWLLSVGGVAQSYVDLDEPAHLEFDYMRRIGDVLDCLRPGPLAVLHVGGGAGSLARYAAATRPGSRQLLVDADDLLVELVSAQLGLRAVPGLAVEVGDGRAALAAAAAGEWDVVVLDAFHQATIPAGMVTLGSVSDVDKALAAGGVCLANVTDGPGLAFVRRVVGTLGAVFEHVVVVGEPAVLRGRRFANVVVAASRDELPVAEVAGLAAGAVFPARVVPGAELMGDPITDDEPVASPLPPEMFT